jgi:membrane-associated phospholipid phosphatase
LRIAARDIGTETAAVRVKTESEITRRRKICSILIAALAAVALAFFVDAFFTAWVDAHASVSLKHAAFLVSRFGDWPAHVAAGFIGAAVAFFAHRRDWLRIFLAMLIGCALAGVAARAIKIGTGRARPLVKTETVWNGPRLSAKYNAFPSGHVASSTAFFATLFFARRKIGAPFLLIPIVIAAARIFAGAHYLSDVTFAVALGLACAVLSTNAIGCQSPRPS